MQVNCLVLVLLMSAAAAQVVGADDSTLAARWDFGAEETMPLVAHGNVQRDQKGPTAPEFPDLAENNTCVRLDGRGAYLAITDPGAESKFDFAQGDGITLEAWVKLDEPRSGSMMYVVGKGRTGSPKFPPDNQNWAMRVVTSGSMAKVTFLFASTQGRGDARWHRWTTNEGFDVSTGWHHVAVAYRFGEPESIRGWIDGQPMTGAWDMAGATKQPPVVDDDAVWIGSSRGGSPSNSFRGWLDAVAIHRGVLDDKTIASRFNRVGGPVVVKPQPEAMPALGDIAPGKVLVTFSEALPAHDRWLNEGEQWPEETARWLGDEFLLPRIARRYDDWGIRSNWKSPVLLRMAADVELPAGTHRVLLRTRGLSRLWIDGQVVARTSGKDQRPPDGEEPMTPVPEPPLPGLRIAGYRQQEVIAETTLPEASDQGKQRRRVVLELVVGGKDIRTETGEVCVALQPSSGETFYILSPGSEAMPLTDAFVEPALARIEQSLSRLDDEHRRAAAALQDDFWNRRHELARNWVESHAPPTVPSSSGESNHPIDAFLAAKIESALAASSGADAEQARRFHGQVLPILQENCFRCHGDKDSGGLKLNSRDLAIAGGDSEMPAVVPGKPEESELLARVSADDESMRMPPTGAGLSAEQVAALSAWIEEGAAWPAPPVAESQVAQPPLVSDEAFLRRIYLDTVGVPPTQQEAEDFLGSRAADRREQLIDHLLADERCADNWMGFWLDMLAENPTLLNFSLNSTGPFRWFVYDSLRDNKPLDRMVTELIAMRGSADEGGSAGFGQAGENDAPMAAKGHIVASAFLGIELQCARCHDSPYHSTTQRDLFSLAAMLQRKTATVPATSRVPAAFFEKKGRESLIRATLKPDEPVPPEWPFAEETGVADSADIDALMRQPSDSRERLAALVTAPHNARFAPVVVNHLWKRLLGAGFVEPANDWEGRQASHPELLDWLAKQFVAHDYDLRHVTRLIVTSHAYQRQAVGNNLAATAEHRFFGAPDPRRLTAEQVVDSLFAATGAAMDTEELTFVHDGRRPIGKRQSLGKPTRAWMLATLNNERDRPSLSLPGARAVADVLEAFGWNGSRQKPIHERDEQPNVLQPGVLANSTLSSTVTRAACHSALAELAVEARSPEQLVDALFLRVLSRRPRAAEREALAAALADSFEERLAPESQVKWPEELPPLPQVTWFNHLRPEANVIQKENEQRVRQGPPPDPRLQPGWREVYEDVVWSLVNHREFVWMP